MTDLPELLKAATPGQWKGAIITQGQPVAEEVIAEFRKHRGGSFGAITTEAGCFVAIITSTDATIHEDYANAQLIALAPTLAALVLEARTALERAKSLLDQYQSYDDLEACATEDTIFRDRLFARDALRTTLAKLGDL